MRLLAAAFCAAGIIPFAACSVLEEAQPLPSPTPTTSTNALVNPGFEAGLAPWATLPAPAAAVVDGGSARTGDAGALLALPDLPDASSLAVVATQTIQPAEFPEFLSGFAFVERWAAPAGALQYIEASVTVHGGDFTDGMATHAVRFALAGAAVEPPAMPEERWVMLNRDQPATGAWTYFGYSLRQAFTDEWGRVPNIWDRIDVTVAVRADGATGSASVRFDDLYLGSHLGDPNRP